MVIALAGRRVDAPETTKVRFPAAHLERVQQDIRAYLQTANARGLVCAAACGADILALEVAGELGMRRRIVLPYDRETFKQSSVIDRPGDWGARYDRILDEVAARGDLVEFAYAKDNDETYFATNHDILDQAAWLARELQQELGVLVVWNGISRGPDDVTGHFLAEARHRGLPATELLTV